MYGYRLEVRQCDSNTAEKAFSFRPRVREYFFPSTQGLCCLYSNWQRILTDTDLISFIWSFPEFGWERYQTSPFLIRYGGKSIGHAIDILVWLRLVKTEAMTRPNSRVMPPKRSNKVRLGKTIISSSSIVIHQRSISCTCPPILSTIFENFSG